MPGSFCVSAPTPLDLSDYIRGHPFKTLANVYVFDPYHPPVTSFVMANLAKV